MARSSVIQRTVAIVLPSGEMLSLCTINIEFNKVSTEVAVVWGKPGGRKKNIRAVVAPAPYKPITMRGGLL
jgi:vanillate/3-O-methylgallate O-demethylase